MAAVEYDFYKTTYGGTSISELEWPGVESRVHAFLDKMKRVWTVTEPVPDSENMAICAMADSQYFMDGAANGGIAVSSSIGSVSSTFKTSESIDLSSKGQEKELRKCAGLYLDIYRGVGKCL